MRHRVVRGAVAAAFLLGFAPGVVHAQDQGTGALPPSTTTAPAELPSTAVPGLPASVDLTSGAVPVGNQGGVNSCVAWTVAHDLLGYYAKTTGQSQTLFAPMYLYSQLNGGLDNGVSVDDALNLASSQGVDTVAHYSHDDFDWHSQPNLAERTNAANYKLSGFQTLFAGDATGSAGRIAIQNALASGHPVAIGMPLRQGWGDVTAANPVYTDITSAMGGGHEMLALGYSAAGLRVQNSWGPDWGDHGYATIGWNVVEHDVWSAAIATGWGQGKAPVINTTGAAARDGQHEIVVGRASLFTGNSATVTIRYGRTSSYGSTFTQTINHAAGSDAMTSFGTTLAGLTPATRYHYSITITNQLGTVSSGDRGFVTAKGPVVNAVGAVTDTGTSETLLGNVNLFGAATGTVTYRYGTTTAYGSTATETVSHTPGGTTQNVFGTTITGLAPGTVYHYAVNVTTSEGTFTTEDKTFITAHAPVLNSAKAVETGPTTVAVFANATLFAAASATATLRYGPTTAYGTSLTKSLSHDQVSPSATFFNFEATGLQPNTVYHYVVTVTNSAGTSTSADKTFVTPAT